MINPYWEFIVLLCLINIVFAISLNLVLGYNGQFSLGHAAFLALGAYSSGVLATHLVRISPTHEPQVWHLLAGVALSLVISTAGAVLVGYPSLRLRGDYLAIATLGFAEIIRIVILALPKDLFGGPTGMQTVPLLRDYFSSTPLLNGLGNLVFTCLYTIAVAAMAAWGLSAGYAWIQRLLARRAQAKPARWLARGVIVLILAAAAWPLYGVYRKVFEYELAFSQASRESKQWTVFLAFTLVLALVTWLIRNYLSSVPGRAVVAIREDEIATTNLGINITWLKLQNFMLSAALAGLAGSMLAHTQTLFRPQDFGFFRSVDVLLMVVLGGMGSLTGSYVGAVLITILPEALRFLDQWRLVIYSLVLILFMIFRPSGLLGSAEIGQLIKLRLSGLWERKGGRPGREAGDA